MAYYSSNYYDSYAGENYQTPYSYGGNYDIVPSSQALTSHSSHEFSGQNLFDYNFTPYYGAYDPSSMNRSAVAYSASTYSEPKSIVYDLYNGGYSPEVETQFRISYSVSEADNDLEFEEYDPTPYGGGYDQAQTYGKPLPHSEAICYPRSHYTPDSGTPTLNGFTTESPYGKENVNDSPLKPHIENEKPPAKEEQQQHIEYDANHDQDDKPPVSDHGSGYNEGGYNYEYEKLVQRNPFGCGSEGMDLCESIFGYWPCLDKYNKRDHDCQQVGDYGENSSSSSNQWNETADYLFGRSSYPPYEERRAGDVIYSYQRHHQPQPHHMQVHDYEENSWISKIF